MADKAPKFDAGKAPLNLIHPIFKDLTARVLAFGAKKYAPWSWMEGKEWSRDLAALHRHLDAWAGGQDVDPETGITHLAHASCDLMFLMVSEALKLGTDDRVKMPVRPPDAPTKLDEVVMSNGTVAYVKDWRAGRCALCCDDRGDLWYVCHDCQMTKMVSEVSDELIAACAANA